jgi:hypothetical protein
MKQALAAFAVASSLLAAAAAYADGMEGNTQFLIGQTYLHDVWKPLDEPSAFGLDVDFAPVNSPVHVALGMSYSGDSATVATPLFGRTGHVAAGFLDFSAGFLWHPVKHHVVRPYLGGGVLRMFAAVDAGANPWNGGDSDQSFGFYGNAGVFFKVGDVFNIGFDGRLVRGTKISLAGTDVDANYGQGSLLIGFSWGGAPRNPEHHEAPPSNEGGAGR